MDSGGRPRRTGRRRAPRRTARELADLLGVHESQVSRDERNDYHGITVDRASRVLDALGVRLVSAFEQPVISEPPKQPTAVTGD